MKHQMSRVNPYITHPKDRRKIHKLRDRFEGGPIADEQLDLYEKMLVRDWSRCKTFGVDPSMRQGILLPEGEFKIAIDSSCFIIEKSEPILNKVSNLLTGVPGILILTDNKGTILYVIGDPSVRLRAAEDSGLVEGARWLESLVNCQKRGRPRFFQRTLLRGLAPVVLRRNADFRSFHQRNSWRC
jgi:transcriptional regulator of acetoin/glycerol metabolism